MSRTSANGITALWFLLLIWTLLFAPVSASSITAPNTGELGQRADFRKQMQAATNAFKDALNGDLDKSQIAAIITYAELSYFESNAADHAALIQALKRGEAFSDQTLSRLALAWRLQFQAIVELKRSEEALALSNNDDDSSTSSQTAMKMVSPALAANSKALVEISRLQVGTDKAVLQLVSRLTAASTFLLSHKTAQASTELAKLNKWHSSSAREAPLILLANRLIATIDHNAGRSAATTLGRLELAEEQTLQHWSTHPALVFTDFSIAEIAFDAKLRQSGHEALSRLSAYSLADSSFDWTKLAELAFSLDDLPIAIPAFIRGLRSSAASMDTSSEHWRDHLRELIDIQFSSGEPTKYLILLSAIIREPDLLPKQTIARRWAFLKLAHGYSNVGENVTAAALGKIAADNPIPSAILHSMVDGEPSDLIAEATRFEPDSDYDVQSRLLKIGIERWIGRGEVVSGKLLLASQLLVTDKLMMGEAKQAVPTIEALLNYIRAQPPKSPSIDGPSDPALIELRVGLDGLASELDRAGLDSIGTDARRIWQDQVRSGIRAFVELNLKSGNKPLAYFYKIDPIAHELFNASRPWPALAIYTNDVLPLLFQDPTGDLHGWDFNLVFDSLENALGQAGDIEIAKQIRATLRSQFNPSDKISSRRACKLLRESVRNATKDTLAIKSFPDLLDALKTLNCEDDDAMDDGLSRIPSAALDWAAEERRLRSISSPLGDSVRVASLTQAIDCKIEADNQVIDDLRRAVLAKLDVSQKSVLQNEILQAELLQQLAALYDSKDTEVPISLRKTALELLINKTMVGPELLASSTNCLIRDLANGNRGQTAIEVVKALNKRVADRYGDQAAQRFIQALKASSISLNEDDVSKYRPADSRDVAEAFLRLNRSGLAEMRGDAITTALLLQKMPATTFSLPETRALVREYMKFVNAKPSFAGDLAKVVLLLDVKLEFLTGSFDRALTLIDRVSESERRQPWNSIDLIDFRDWLAEFVSYANIIKSARRSLNQLRTESPKLNGQSIGGPAQRAIFLSKIVTASSLAHNYKLALESFKELVSLRIPFEGGDGYLARDSVVELVAQVATQCTQSVQIVLSQTLDSVLAECADTAINMAATASADRLRQDNEIQEGGDESVREGVEWGISELLGSIAPLLAGRADHHQDDLAEVFRWQVARNATSASNVARQRVEQQVTSKGSPDQAEQLANWRRKRSIWMHLEGRYQCGLAVGEASNTELASLTDQSREDAAGAWQLLEQTLPSGRDAAKLPDLDVADLRTSLQPDEVILSYSVSRSNISIWIVRRDGIDFRMVQSETFQKDISGLVGQMSVSMTTGRLPDFRVVEANRLYRDLIGPIADRLSGVAKLFIEPDATTSRIPFAALVSGIPSASTWSVDEQSWTPEWLAKRYVISIIPSSSTFAFDRRRSRNLSGRILATGDPQVPIGIPQTQSDECARLLGGTVERGTFVQTPGATEELSEIKQLAGDRGASLVGKDFVPDNLRALSLRPYGLLVFATHGEAEKGIEPARLIFSPTIVDGKARSNFVSSIEVRELDLDADLIILSACDTGIRGGSNGGLNSLMSAFLSAGTKQIVATAWPIGAVTASAITLPLVQHYLAFGAVNIDEAVQGAVRSMIDAKPGSAVRHPYFWAGIFLLGPSWRL
jgi:CHAT domain-containing protein